MGQDTNKRRTCAVREGPLESSSGGGGGGVAQEELSGCLPESSTRRNANGPCGCEECEEDVMRKPRSDARVEFKLYPSEWK